MAREKKAKTVELNGKIVKIDKGTSVKVCNVCNKLQEISFGWCSGCYTFQD